MSDLKYALRMLLKPPGSTFIAMITLALVIGTMSLMFGVIEHESSAWMPFPEPERMVRLWQFGKERPREDFPTSVYAEAASRIKGLEAIGGLGFHGSQVLNGVGEPQSFSIQHVTASVFDVAGIQPLLGRTFTTEEQRNGREDLVVIGFDTWQSVFQREKTVIGRVVQLNNVPCTIIGVMPKGFEHNALFFGLDAWLPKDFESASNNQHWIRIVGRREPGVTAAQLDSEVDAVMTPLLVASGQMRGWEPAPLTARTFPLKKRPGGRELGPVLTGVLLVVFVVAIAVFNVATILLGRILTRRHEFAVRFALGAPRRRIIRQLLTESVVLSLLGAGLGVFTAIWVAGWAATHRVEARFSPLVLGCTMLASVVIGVAVGWLPAWRATRGDMLNDLKEPGNGASGGSSRHRLRNFLVVSQVAMATALCIAAGLLVRSYFNKQQFDPGFDTSRLITVDASLNQKLYAEPDQRLVYAQQALDELRTLPGVEDVALCSDRTIDRFPFPISFHLEGQASWPQGQMVKLTLATPNYLPMVNVPVLRGRGLDETDRLGTPAVAVVNQTFADRYFSGQDLLGQRFGVAVEENREWITIVGVVPDRRNLGNEQDLGAEAYLCAYQFAPVWSSTSFLVRTQPNPAVLRDALRNALRSVDRNVPVGNALTIDSQIEQAIRRNVAGMQSFGAIGLFGLIMATLGIYGVVAYSVVNRTRELGIRMALGATRGETLGLVVRQGLRHVLIGLGAGVALGVVMTFGMRELLYGVQPFDPLTYGAVGAIMFATCLLAMLIPARRTLQINPVEALRHE